MNNNFRDEEREKIEAERRVQEKRMDQTEALIASIRAQVEKEKAAKAAKEAENQRFAAKKNNASNNSGGKQQFRTISPEEMERLQEKKRIKAAGLDPDTATPEELEQLGLGGDKSEGLSGLGKGPTLQDVATEGPTLSNPTAGQESLLNQKSDGGLGIHIVGEEQNESGADESTIALNVNEINSAAAGTVVVDDDKTWSDSNNASSNDDELRWVSSETTEDKINVSNNGITDENGDIISVVPVRKKPNSSNDVHSAYNIDFDDDDDDDTISFTGSNSSTIWAA
ncbi:MAG: hypothetical protein Q4D51_08105, partial [Eubacteriales bacterium]|nr:hypothetical protein [Eubacteriales bacterium]